MITTFQALVVALLAVLPGATYTFAYERHAGAYGAHLSDRLVRFLVVSGIFHAALAGPEFALQKKLLADSADPASWWQIETIAVVYVALPFVAGSTLGWATQKDKRWARAVVGSSRYPRAWDHLWSQGGRMIVRVKLRSGEHLAGLFEPSANGINSYASGYGEEADLYLSRQLRVDAKSGEFDVDAQGSPVPYEPETGLFLRAEDVELWHIQEVADG